MGRVKKDQADTPVAESQDATKRRLYSEAMSTLRARHQGEFHEILGEKYAEAGLKYQRRLTAEEKERQQAIDLLAKYPDLATAFAEQGTVANQPDGTEPTEG